MWIYSSTSNTFTNGVVHFRLALAPAASLDGCSPLARFSVSAGLDFHHKKAVFQAAARQSASLFATHHPHDPRSKLLKLKAKLGGSYAFANGLHRPRPPTFQRNAAP